MIQFKVANQFRNRKRQDLKKATIASMRRLFRDALEEWIREAVKNIHVDTGMSVHSLLRLTGAARLRTKLESEIFRFGPAKPGDSTQGYPVPQLPEGYLRSKTLGERLGSKAFRLNLGNEKARTSITMSFSFKIVVLQYYINERNKWRSLEKANKAWEIYLVENWADYLPSIQNWMVNGTALSRK